MKLYYCPGTCSLAVRIALLEADLKFETVEVDLRKKRTVQGEDFLAINPKGYVPTLVLDDQSQLSEMVSTLYWIETEHGKAQGVNHLALLDMLSCLSTEVHKYFLLATFLPNDEAKDYARSKIAQRYDWLGGQLKGQYLFGDTPTSADAYLHVTVRWALSGKSASAVPASLKQFHATFGARPAARAALEAEGLAA